MKIADTLAEAGHGALLQKRFEAGEVRADEVLHPYRFSGVSFPARSLARAATLRLHTGWISVAIASDNCRKHRLAYGQASKDVELGRVAGKYSVIAKDCVTVWPS